MPNENLKLVVWVIETQAIESLALYDAQDSECGVADLIERLPDEATGAVRERWQLECHAGGNIFTSHCGSLDEALAWLTAKRDALLPGGYIRAVADFRIDEAGKGIA